MARSGAASSQEPRGASPEPNRCGNTSPALSRPNILKQHVPGAPLSRAGPATAAVGLMERRWRQRGPRTGPGRSEPGPENSAPLPAAARRPWPPPPPPPPFFAPSPPPPPASAALPRMLGLCNGPGARAGPGRARAAGQGRAGGCEGLWAPSTGGAEGAPLSPRSRCGSARCVSGTGTAAKSRPFRSRCRRRRRRRVGFLRARPLPRPPAVGAAAARIPELWLCERSTWRPRQP